MALFVLRKLILQTRMRSHPVGLDVWFLVGPFVYFHTSCVRTAKALVRLRGCAGSPEPLLVAYVIRNHNLMSWLISNMQLQNHENMNIRSTAYNDEYHSDRVFGQMSHVIRKPVFAICEQQRRRSACASAQSDQHLCCSLPG